MYDSEACTIKLGTSKKVCLLVITCIMYIPQLAVGAVYKDDCPQQPFIPIYLMVMGAVVPLQIAHILACTANLRGNFICNLQHGPVILFLFFWFIAGNMWIQTIYEPNYDKTTVEPYCDKTVYLFALWSINLFYILLGLMMFICCIGLLLAFLIHLISFLLRSEERRHMRAASTETSYCDQLIKLISYITAVSYRSEGR